MTAPQIFKAERMTSAAYCARIGAFETLAHAKAEATRIAAEIDADAQAQRAALQAELAQMRSKAMAEAKAEVESYMAAEKAQQMGDALRDTLRLSAALEKDFEASEEWLTSLIVQAVQRVLTALPSDTLDLELVRSAIKESGDRWRLQLQVPQAMHGQIEELLRLTGPEFDCIESVVAKSDLEPGQMLLLSAGGITDITLDVQIKTLSQVIRSACLEAAGDGV